MKKIILILMSVLLIFSLVACSHPKDDDKNNMNQTSDITSETDQIDNTDETENKTDETTNEISAEDRLKQKQEECENALKEIKVDLLSITHEKYEDAEINGYLVYSEDYETATLLTIGVHMTKNTYYDYYDGTRVTGETATGKDGDLAVQTSYSTSWISDDREYAIMVLRVGGDVDPSKVTVLLKGKVDGVSVETKFENDGEPIGFEDAKTHFMDDKNTFGCGSDIVKLVGRHYLIIRRYASSTGWGGNSTRDYRTYTQSFVLIPLEQGFSKTLTKDDVKMIMSGSVENTTGNLLVNESGRIDASSMEKQTTLEVEFIREVVEPRNSDNLYDDEVYDKIDQDIKELMEMTYLEIDDGDGNTIVLKMK